MIIPISASERSKGHWHKEGKRLFNYSQGNLQHELVYQNQFMIAL